jgi:hypothetical protein
VVNTPLKVVAERFPLLKEQAARRFACDENFRDLCEDYVICAETVAHLESTANPPDGLREEYAALLLRLECELLRHLQEHARGEES